MAANTDYPWREQEKGNSWLRGVAEPTEDGLAEWKPTIVMAGKTCEVKGKAEGSTQSSCRLVSSEGRKGTLTDSWWIGKDLTEKISTPWKWSSDRDTSARLGACESSGPITRIPNKQLPGARLQAANCRCLYCRCRYQEADFLYQLSLSFQRWHPI